MIYEFLGHFDTLVSAHGTPLDILVSGGGGPRTAQRENYLRLPRDRVGVCPVSEILKSCSTSSQLSRYGTGEFARPEQ